MRIILGSMIGVAAAILGSVLVHRKLRQRRVAGAMQIRGAHGIAEEGFVKIGGIEQWIGVRGEDEANPVMLVIHGGPGSSCSIFTPLIQSWET